MKGSEGLLHYGRLVGAEIENRRLLLHVEVNMNDSLIETVGVPQHLRLHLESYTTDSSVSQEQAQNSEACHYCGHTEWHEVIERNKGAIVVYYVCKNCTSNTPHTHGHADELEDVRKIAQGYRSHGIRPYKL